MREVKRVWVVHSPGREEAREVAERARRALERAGVSAEVLTEASFTKGVPDLVVTVGGDGTFLRTAAAVYPQEIPILPALLGGVGFLSACRAEELEAALSEILAGKGRVERRGRLLGQGPGFSATALNEFALVGTAQNRFVELRVRVGEEEVGQFGGDGLVVATPTGSTAYALAAGGPILWPTLPTIILVPLCPHRLGLRPAVVPETLPVEVETLRPTVVLADGEPVGALSPGGKILLRRAPKDTLLVRLPQTPPLFSRLREKLGWP